MNDPTPLEIGLKIPKNPDEIREYTLEVLETLSKHVTLSGLIKQKIKLILMELVTNSIKHSQDPDASIKLTLNHPQLTIEKVDKGLQIRFNGVEQIPFDEVDKTIKVSFSKKNSYDIQILNSYHIKFIDNFKEDMNINHMPEHFGLYIITVASDNFEYLHNPESQENTFIVNVNL